MCWYRRFMDPWCLKFRLSNIDIGVQLFASFGWRYYSLFPRWIGKVLPLGQLVPRRGTEVVSVESTDIDHYGVKRRWCKDRASSVTTFLVITGRVVYGSKGQISIVRRQHSHANSSGCRVFVTHRGRCSDNGILRIVRGLDAAHNLSS